MERIPAYKMVYSTLKKQIRDGSYNIGDLIPTESELETIFSVSRTTIRRAVGVLSTEGYVKVIQGKGTVVQNAFTSQRLNSITSVTETLRAKGHVVTTQGRVIELVTAPPAVAEALELKPDAPVYKVQRVQCADGMPIAIMENYLRASAFPNLDQQYQNDFVSLYSFMEERYSIILKHAVETISAISASFLESQILHLAAGAPLLCSKRISVSEQNVPVEYGITKLVADKYEYTVMLSGRH